MDRINLTDNGGFPFEQDTLAFLQNSYMRPLAALAKLCGEKTILEGVEVVGANVSAGFISYNGELILFQQCSIGTDVVIQETPTAVLFEDGILKAEYFVRTAVCGSVGNFPFADLVPLLSLKNIWKKDDLRMCKKNTAYINANFDPATGIGITPEERGWQILGMQDANAAGKAFVNIDPADIDFDEAGKTAGAKTHTLTRAQLPIDRLAMFNNSVDNGGPIIDGNNAVARSKISGGNLEYEMRQGTGQPTVGLTAPMGSGQAHNIVQPSYAILTLIKL